MDVIWKGGAGEDHLAETRELYAFAPLYASLDATALERVDVAMRELTLEQAIDARLRPTSPVAIIVGERRPPARPP